MRRCGHHAGLPELLGYLLGVGQEVAKIASTKGVIDDRTPKGPQELSALPGDALWLLSGLGSYGLAVMLRDVRGW